MTAQPQAAPVDAETATLLDVIATDRVHEDDRAKVEAAIRETAAANGGVMDPNELRKRLYNERGLCSVYPPAKPADPDRPGQGAIRVTRAGLDAFIASLERKAS